MELQTFEEFSDRDLERIERLIEASTGGPWYSYVAGRDPGVDANCIEVGACDELGTFKSIQVLGGTVADQDFIASARQDLPRLLLEVRQLRARLSRLRSVETNMRLQTLSNPESPAVLSA